MRLPARRGRPGTAGAGDRDGDVSERAWIDGAWCAASAVVPGTQGAFETIGAFASGLPLWRRHLHRLRHAAARLDLPWHLPRGLRASALALLHHNGHGVLRL